MGMVDSQSKYKNSVFKKTPNINNAELLDEFMSILLLGAVHSDVAFLVGEKEFKVHRAILAVHSPVFAKMLLDKSYKEANETDRPINLPGKSSTAFEAFIKFIYNCRVDLNGFDLDTVIDVLFMAHEYQVDRLVKALDKVLKGIIVFDTGFRIFEAAILLNDQELLGSCREYLCPRAEMILKGPQFLELSKNAVIDLILRDDFSAREVEILRAVKAWGDHNKLADIKDVLEKIRFDLVCFDGLPMALVFDLCQLLMANQIDLKSKSSALHSNPRTFPTGGQNLFSSVFQDHSHKLDDSRINVEPVVFKNTPMINEADLLHHIMSRLLLGSINSDVTFSVAEKQFKAHRAILAVQSPNFAEMLLNNTNEPSHVINLPNKSAAAFEVFLQFVYTRTIELTELGLDTVIEVLFMAHEYQIHDLIKALNKVLQKNISLETVFHVFEVAILLGDEEILVSCRNVLCLNADTILNNSQFCELSKKAVYDLISRDDFRASEVDILCAVKRWHDHKKMPVSDELLEKIRFDRVSIAAMSMAQIFPLCEFLISNGIELERVGSSSPSSNPRKPFVESQNIATQANGTTVEGVTSSSDIGYVFSHGNHCAYQSPDRPITIVLPRICSFASMSFFMAASKFQYAVELSCDNVTWSMLATKCSCVSCYGSQLLMFSPKTAKYVRINPKSSRCYGVTSFQCPSDSITDEDRRRYEEHCPNGGVLLYQINQNNRGVSTVVTIDEHQQQ